MNAHLPLVDSLGRRHNNLRISVTDRCNIRCFYCMPDENLRFLPRHDLLTFEEITQIARVFAHCGVDHIRLTGGEPLVRDQLPTLIEMLKSIEGIQDIAMTTNAVLLGKYARALREAGLDRLNISLDALARETFVKITRRDVLDQVLSGIDAALDAGFANIRLNAVAIANLSEPEIVPLAQFALAKGLELRFIEFMPLDSEQHWDDSQVLSGERIKAIMQAEFGPIVAAPRPNLSQPAVDFFYANGQGRLGLINPVSQPFCDACNRVRLTAEGKMRNCLFSIQEWDLRSILRDDDSSGERETRLATTIGQCVAAKLPGHLIGQATFQRPAKSMYQIGG